MAGSVNKVILVGRLGRDPEVKYTPGGVAVCKFSVATDEQWKDKDGQRQTRTEWHHIVAWNKLAEICGQYLTKGKQVYLEGQIRSREWEKDGIKRTSFEIIAQQMTMLGSKGDGGRPADTPNASAPAAASVDEDAGAMGNEADIPF